MMSRDHLIVTLKPTGLVEGIRRAFGLLNRTEKVRAVFVVLSMNVNAVLGLVGLAGVLPFVHLMLVPDPMAGDGVSARALRWLGFTDPNPAIYAAGLVLIGLVLLKNGFAFCHSYFQNQFCAQAERRMATELLDRVVHAPYVWVAARNPSTLRDVVVGQAIEWSRGVIRTTLQFVNDLLFLCLALALLVIASPQAGLFIAGFAVLVAVMLTRITRRPISTQTERKRHGIRVAGVIAAEAIEGGRDVRLSGAGADFVSAFDEQIGNYTAGEASGRQWQLLPRLGIEVIGFVVLVGVALAALWGGMPRADVAGLLAVYALVAMRAIPVVSQAAVSISAITASLPAATEVKNLLDELPPVPDRTPAKSAAPIVWQRLIFERVSFTYPNGEHPALRPIDLVVESGRSYGIVGKSGAGKSTLIDLLTGLLPPGEGRILVDNVPLDRVGFDRWIDNVACVSQVPFLLDGTLRENIEFGKIPGEDGTERLERSIDAAGLRQLVDQLPDGLRTLMGDRGVRLSGGQRQRVAIARALYRGAHLLVLDEATSALDSLTEREVTHAIESLKGRMTLLVVAHRLSTVARLDELIVLDDGAIAARGSHQALLGSSKLYRMLVQAQSLGAVETPAA